MINEKDPMTGKKILVVDDQPHIDLIRSHLESDGFVVLEALRGQDAVDMAFDHHPSLVILDLVLSGMGGHEVVKILRRHETTREIPIIVLSAMSGEEDKVMAFEIGVDDYMTKPFSPKELVVRARAILRRSSLTEEGKNGFQIGNLTIDIEKYEILVNGKKQEFPPKEFELLKLMAKNPYKVFSRKYLLEKIWGYDYLGDTRTVDVHMHHVRQKLLQAEGQVSIETVRGKGYKLNTH